MRDDGLAVRTRGGVCCVNSSAMVEYFDTIV